MKKEFINGKKYIYEKEDLIIEVIFDIENGEPVTHFWVSRINYGLKSYAFGIPEKLKEKDIKKYLLTAKYYFIKGIKEEFEEIEEMQNKKIMNEYYKKKV